MLQCEEPAHYISHLHSAACFQKKQSMEIIFVGQCKQHEAICYCAFPCLYSMLHNGILILVSSFLYPITKILPLLILLLPLMNTIKHSFVNCITQLFKSNLFNINFSSLGFFRVVIFLVVCLRKLKLWLAICCTPALNCKFSVNLVFQSFLFYFSTLSNGGIGEMMEKIESMRFEVNNSSAPVSQALVAELLEASHI